MSFNAAALQLLLDKGLSLADVVEVAAANERRSDPTATERKRRQREREKVDRDMSQRDVTRDPSPKVSPKDNNQTPSSPPVEVSEARASSPQPRPWALPAGVSLQVWTDFLGNRKRKRLGTSDTAWAHFLGDLKRVSSQTGIPPPQLIEQCTAKGWGAIYDPRNEQDERRSNTLGRNQPSDGLSSTARAALQVFGPG